MLTLHDLAQVVEAQKRFPYWTLLLVVGLAIAAWSIINATTNILPWERSGDVSAPAQVGQPAAQPVQPAPVVVPPVVPTLRIRADGPWVEVGTARNGPQGRALPVPWDQLVMLPVTPENKALWFEIAKLDPPPASNIPNVNPVTGWSGYFREGNKLILYAYSDYRWSKQDPQVLSYWRREATIEGLSP